ncbi:MAG: hypothetical protein KC657_05980 [Myxococcales bacterium]|nr:hypothetical protein [Myxococcales bacterium]
MRRIELSMDADDSAEHVPLLLVRRAAWARDDAGLTPPDARVTARALERHDRLSPWSAGAIMGGLAALSSVAVANALDPSLAPRLLALTHRLAGSTQAVTVAIAAGATFCAGAILGAAFATMTRNLRRLLPLSIWALVFLPSLGLACQASVVAFTRFGTGTSPVALLAACATFALTVTLSLPLRRRERPAWIDDAA